jgi:hypothetical protein
VRDIRAAIRHVRVPDEQRALLVDKVDLGHAAVGDPVVTAAGWSFIALGA